MAGERRRRTPEELLREVQKARPKKGYLKIFLGYASGVGKSFRMLDAARRRRERGQDVVVGAVQPKMSPEVEAVLQEGGDYSAHDKSARARSSMWKPSSRGAP